MTRRVPVSAGSSHARHDPLLVARHAAGDLPPSEAAEARAILAFCEACAALTADLEAISRAAASLPTPRRTRDFRITAAQAEALRGSWLQRQFRRLAAPRAAILQPLAGAAVAIGLVLVVVGGTGLPAGQAPATDPEQRIAAAATAEAYELPTGTDSGDLLTGAPLPASTASAPQEGAPAPAGAETDGGTRPDAATPGATAAPGALAPPPSTARPTTGGAAQVPRDGLAGGDTGAPAGEAEAAVRPTGTGDITLIVLGATLAAAGILLLLARLMARRSVRDPLLR